MQIPENLKFTKDHEWVRVEGSEAVVGITEFAQQELGEVVFYDPPATGKTVKKGETLCVVESTKAASDVYAPISGKVKEANTSLSNSPSDINESSYEKGWLVRLSDIKAEELDGLMSSAEYKKHIGV